MMLGGVIVYWVVLFDEEKIKLLFYEMKVKCMELSFLFNFLYECGVSVK